VSNSLLRSLSMKEAKYLIGNLAQTNQYFVNIPVPLTLKDYFDKVYKREDVGASIVAFVNSKLGFFCSEATLPVSSYATAEVKDNYMGVTQEFAHTRLYTDMDMTFYVDDNYELLRFFEGWMDFISGAGELSQVNGGKHYYRRFQFPDHYKIDNLTITKFEKSFNTELIYNFINAFPKGLTSIPVSYGPAELLKVTVTFNFDRYIATKNKLTSTGGNAQRGETGGVVSDGNSSAEEFDTQNGRFLGPPKSRSLGNSQASLDELYWAARQGKIKRPSDLPRGGE